MLRRSSDERVVGWTVGFVDALRAGSAVAAAAVLDEALADGMEPAAVHSRVIEPAMYRIGELWQDGAITVEDEHVATAISHGVLARLFPRLLSAPARSRERVILAAAEGEHHVLGLRMAADVLEGAGFDVLYLGADVPGDALLSACRAHRPAILGLSATMTLNVPTLIWELAQLELLEERPVVMVGGQGIPPAIDRVLGVTQIAQSEGVVATVEVLLEQPPAGPLVPPDLVRRIPAGPPVSFVGIGAIGTVADTLSATTLAAADAARDAARHAFAMEQLAYRDPLTELWNRRAYDDRFHRIVDEGPGELAVLMLDVDGFKAINDRYGHRAGDLGLVGVARAIIHSVRPGDFAARFGGDEFAVLLPDSKTSEAVAVADRIRQAVERDLTHPPLTISVGVAAFRDSLRSTSLAVDQALYDAKQTGRNRVTLWEP